MEKDKNIIFDKDVSLEILNLKKIAIIGYGNQGRAQALNLKDSELEVKVGLRASSFSLDKVKNDGLETMLIKDAVKWADIISILLPDKNISSAYNNHILPYLSKGKTVLFSHGYNIHYNKIDLVKDINVIMVAPSAGGNIVREEYKKKYGVPTLLAVHQDYTGDSWEITKAYAKAIGGTKVCAFISTFKEETETDLFGEQAILTGGLPFLVKSAYNTLVENGYSKTVAWFVCYYELKTIVDLFHKNGFEEFYKLISDTARYGGITRGKYLIDGNFERKLQKMINSIKGGDFDKELSKNNDSNKVPDSFKDIISSTKKIFDIINKN